MVDNLRQPGTGELIAHEDVAGVMFPRHKEMSNMWLEVAKGSVLNHVGVNVFGYNALVADAATEEVWDGSATYVYPGTALMTKISQTVDQVAMRGGDVEIIGLDADWNLVTQTATLDASLTTTAVVLTTALIRVFSARIMEAVVIDSTVRVHNTAENQDYAVIGIGNNRTQMALYTIPNGKTGYLIGYYGGAVQTTALGKPESTEFRLWTADRDVSAEFEIVSRLFLPVSSPHVSLDYRPYVQLTQKTDIKITASPVSATAAPFAGFDLVLVDN